MPKSKVEEMSIPFLEEKIHEERRDRFTPEIVEMVIKYYGKVSIPTLLDGINLHFGTHFTLPQLSHLIYGRLRGKVKMMRPEKARKT